MPYVMIYPNRMSKEMQECEKTAFTLYPPLQCLSIYLGFIQT